MSGKVTDLRIQNEINQDYISYIKNMPTEYYSAFNFEYGIDLSNNLYTKSPFTNQTDKTISLSALKEICTAILKQTDVKDYASLITSLSEVFMQLPTSEDFILSQYDILREDGTMSYPNNLNEIAIVVNNQNELSDLMLAQLGYYTQEEFINSIYKATDDERYNPLLDKTKISYEDLLGKKFTWYPNNSVYTKTENNMQSPFLYNPYVTSDFTDGIELTITAILRPKEGLSYGSLLTGMYHTDKLTEAILENSKQSVIVNYLLTLNQESFTSGEFISDMGTLQMGIKYNYSFVYDGIEFNDQVGFIGSQNMFSSLMGSQSGTNVPNYYTLSLRELGGENLPSKISIYPVDFEIKDKLTEYLDDWNEEGDIIVNDVTLTQADRPEIKYSDNLAIVIDMISGMISIVTTALVAFTALSLVVSTVMIAIITYVSVIERIKEIGVIRSLGGRKKDISRLFIAESGIIGCIAGIIGIIVTWILTIIINTVSGLPIATLTILIAIIMISISIGLTLISGLIPARAASKKDPVVALRSE